MRTCPAEARSGNRRTVRVDVCVDTCTDVCVDVSTDTRTDMRTDIWADLDSDGQWTCEEMCVHTGMRTDNTYGRV